MPYNETAMYDLCATCQNQREDCVGFPGSPLCYFNLGRTAGNAIIQIGEARAHEDSLGEQTGREDLERATNKFEEVKDYFAKGDK